MLKRIRISGVGLVKICFVVGFVFGFFGFVLFCGLGLVKVCGLGLGLD